jgi:beta-propeller repeat-containing protein
MESRRKPLRAGGIMATALVLGMTGHGALAAAPIAADTAELERAFGKLPLSFEPNQGQTDGRVRFLSRGNGFGLFLTSTEAVLVLRESASPAATSTLRMGLVGANPRPQAEGLEPFAGKSNYFVGSDPRKWRTDVPTYAKVKYEAVYPGVDLVYYGTQGRELEYDFVVAPGADPAAIRLRFAGAERLEQTADGDLRLHVAGGPVRLRRPVVYQDENGARQEIAAAFVRRGANEVTVQVGAYDAARPLVIDPVLVYSTYLGGTGLDAGLEIAVNAHGSAFVTGLTTSLDFPPAPAAPHLGPGGAWDAFVARLTPAGNSLMYSTYLGGSADENTHGGVSFGGIAIDAADNAYVTGITKSRDFPTTAGAFRTTLNGYADAYVAKLNPAGNALVYSTFLGGSGFDGGQGIAVDALGQAYVTGQDESGDLPLVGAFAKHSLGCGSGYKDGFLAKLDAAGSALVYSTYFGGKACNLGWGITVDAAQDAFVMGETVSPDFPVTATAFDPKCGTDGTCNGGISDIFVTKVSTLLAGSASLSYSTFLGGSGEERVVYNGSVAVDGAGRLVYVTGMTASVAPADFPVFHAAQPVPSGPADAFITKLDIAQPPASQLVYSTYLGGPGGDFGSGIVADINGNAYLAGSSGGTFPSTTGMPTCTDPGVVVAKLSPTGAIKWAGCVSGAGQDSGLDVAVDPAGSAYFTGWSESYNFPLVNPLQPVFAGGGTPPADGFVLKISDALDHFKCYDVELPQHFLPFDVLLRDQFEKQVVTVVRPLSLCNPTAKCVGRECMPVSNPDDHLVCYETTDKEGTPAFEPRDVIVSNQFGGEQRLRVLRRRQELCLPSLKQH